MKLKPFLVLALCVFVSPASAETGYDGWLRYSRIRDDDVHRKYDRLPAVVHRTSDAAMLQSAEEELIRGVLGMLGRILRAEPERPAQSTVWLGTLNDLRQEFADLEAIEELVEDGFLIKTIVREGKQHVVIAGSNDRGVLYGTFYLLRRIALHQDIDALDVETQPYASIRMLNHWDNLDGSIERGYAGDSVFWENDRIPQDLSRVRDYARLMASLGINGCSINNVNADDRVISSEYLPDVARVAEVFRQWGVKTYISLNFASPRVIGGIDSFDPVAPETVEFWQSAIDQIYREIPDLGGFVLKADSEGRLGPSEYGRTHADAANVIARAAKPHGGVLFYRGFVYDHRMDWRDMSLDRATAAYDNFHHLDGEFEDNVIIQIKHGPIDFQVREPASPLFGGLEKTNQAIELQITQEYLGQQKHLCYVVPMWKEVLDFDMHARGEGTPVKQLVAGKTFDRPTGGLVGVSNVGRDTNWLGHHLAMANLYGFGRLAWDPNLSSEQIAEEWTRLTFDHHPQVVDTIVEMQLRSWPIYESYTGNLGIGTLTDIIHIHFGPAPESSEYNGWGQWHRASNIGVGMNRTVATGTGYIGQYRDPVAEKYESLETCPDDLLLFLHHVPYTHVLTNGKTVIQHFYDEHYQGAEDAKWLARQWESLRGLVDEQRFEEVLERQLYQADHADVWRDSICRWFFEKSQIPDEHGRVNSYPHRLEAEDLQLEGYEPIDIVPWEAASNSRAASVPESVDVGIISFEFEGKSGWYDLAVQYFDEEDGVSTFQVFIGEQLVDTWIADDSVPTPSDKPDAHTSSRRWIRGIALRAGDVVRLVGTADGGERAVVDYFKLLRWE